MIGVILYFLFTIPVSFIGGFWINQVCYFVLFLLFCFDFSGRYIYLGISYIWGLDLISYVIILLTFWICSLIILASSGINLSGYYSSLFLFTVLVLTVSLVCTFASMNLFVFYLFFEISLIPTLFLIVGWGYQPDRIQAGVYLLFYTLLVPLPMMICVFYVDSKEFTLNFCLMKEQLNILMFYLCLNTVFFVKMPMYFVHLWLPKEARVSGSIILAGIMLKLGGYGLVRLMAVVIPVAVKINYVFLTISGVFFFNFLLCACISIVLSLW